MKLARLSTGTVLFGLDVVLVVLAWPLLLIAARPDILALFTPTADMRGVLYPVADLVALYAMGLYRRDSILETGRSLSRVPLVVGMGAALAELGAVIPPLVVPRVFVHPVLRDQAQLFALATVCFTACAFVARLAVDGLLHWRLLRRRLLVVGAGQRAWDLLHMLGREGSSLHYDVALLHDPSHGAVDPRLAANPLIHILDSAAVDALTAARAVDADQIVVAPDDRRGMDLMQLLDCKVAGFPVVPYLSFVEKEIRRVDLKRMELGWLVYSEGFSFGAIDHFLKRVLDLGVSVLVLLLAAPLLLGAILAIWSEGKGPIFYHQERVTQFGRVFRIVKLRTMRVDAEAQGAVWAASEDARITRAGAFLRRSRIDELPQLWNVLKGEMSFVGPRPERPVFVEELVAQIPLYQERHLVKAGLTGWAQINYPYGASIDDARSKLSYDLYYVKNFSILFDFVILLQTLRVVLWPSGVR
ncbi:MAG: TIGR03013 family PEP-CTERM/XrtA system glycosyltransferase [Acetobacteraceae bacterium]|nr:TIGR03013 family PEP-CTERM/XrtA system glycosyltransferase [Acetobacteraceae bacterium]